MQQTEAHIRDTIVSYERNIRVELANGDRGLVRGGWRAIDADDCVRLCNVNGFRSDIRCQEKLVPISEIARVR